MGIPGEVFVSACEAASDKVHKSIVKQLLSVENFPIFKKMMITRNKELNAQAMQELHKSGQANADEVKQVKEEAEKAEKEEEQSLQT